MYLAVTRTASASPHGQKNFLFFIRLGLGYEIFSLNQLGALLFRVRKHDPFKHLDSSSLFVHVLVLHSATLLVSSTFFVVVIPLLLLSFDDSSCHKRFLFLSPHQMAQNIPWRFFTLVMSGMSISHNTIPLISLPLMKSVAFSSRKIFLMPSFFFRNYFKDV